MKTMIETLTWFKLRKLSISSYPSKWLWKQSKRRSRKNPYKSLKSSVRRLPHHAKAHLANSHLVRTYSGSHWLRHNRSKLLPQTRQLPQLLLTIRRTRAALATSRLSMWSWTLAVRLRSRQMRNYRKTKKMRKKIAN